MANYIANFGLAHLTETEESTVDFLNAIVQDGDAIAGYYWRPYLNRHFGNAQFIVRTDIIPETRQLVLTGLDTHSSGRCIWNTLVLKEITEKDADVTERKCLLCRPDGHGVAVVNIVNADVLPSFLTDDSITLQMIAFPIAMMYYKDEASYEKSQSQDVMGKKWLFDNGAVYPSGYMDYQNSRSPEPEKNYVDIDSTLIRGTVKDLFYGKLQFGEKEYNGFIRCIIDTNFGELELIHTYDQIPAEMQEHIKIGAIVFGEFVLSGDAAIYDYKAGFLKDEEHHLDAMRQTFVRGEAERLRQILAVDAAYHSEVSKKEAHGADEIIAFLSEVHEANGGYFAYKATIVETNADNSGERCGNDNGKRCIVLANGDENDYESVVLIELNEDRLITDIALKKYDKYHFKIDDKPEIDSPLDDIELPKTVYELILNRARFHGLIGCNTNNEELIEYAERQKDCSGNAQRMIDAFWEQPLANGEEVLENIFGYLFTRAIFKVRNEGWPPLSSADAFAGIPFSSGQAGEEEKNNKEYEIGKQFYRDFVSFMITDEITQERFNEEIVSALTIVQSIAQIYANK